jgi:hypothetical protein
MWKIDEQWCFSNGKRKVRNCGTMVFWQWGKCEKLLNIGVPAMGKERSVSQDEAWLFLK